MLHVIFHDSFLALRKISLRMKAGFIATIKGLAMTEYGFEVLHSDPIKDAHSIGRNRTHATNQSVSQHYGPPFTHLPGYHALTFATVTHW